MPGFARAAGPPSRTASILDRAPRLRANRRRGEYFWVDIARDGLVLFDRPGYRLASPQPLTPADAYEMAKRYFDVWKPKIERWLVTVDLQVGQSARDKDFLTNAAFTLHQAIETAYACFLLVRTLYLPRSHNIKFLRSLCEDLDKRLVPVWPRGTRKERGPFELLKRAYIEARYSEHYRIGADQLAQLTICAEALRGRVEEACLDWLETLREQKETPA